MQLNVFNLIIPHGIINKVHLKNANNCSNINNSYAASAVINISIQFAKCLWVGAKKKANRKGICTINKR